MDADAAARDVPQSEPLNDAQVMNNAGGYVFKIDDMDRLRRFIILGADANNYYVSRDGMELQNAECVLRLLAAGQGERVVDEVKCISQEGRAPRQSPGIFVLAICARLGDAATRRAALAAVPAVCRTASTLFEWVQRCKELGEAARAVRTGDDAAEPRAVLDWVSWGRAMRRTVSRWYLDRSPAAVAYQATKYSQRNGWSHADLLRLAHPDPELHAAKRQKREQAAAEAAAATGAAEAEVGAEAAAPKVVEAAGGQESDDEWVVLQPSAAAVGDDDEDGAEGGAAATEQGALAAAAAEAAAAVAAAAASGGGEVNSAAVAAAAEALRVADMKAIFAFLTHGTLPGQAKPARRSKAAAAASAAAADGTESNAVEAPAAGGDMEVTTASAAPAPAPAADADADAPAPTPAPELSPVMQYLFDAHRLRKVIRAPPPLIKEPKPASAGPSGARGGGKRRRGRGAAAVAAASSSGDERAAAGDDSKSAAEEEQRPQQPSPDAVAANATEHAAAVEAAVALIRRHRFGHEHVGDTGLLRCPEVWSAFLEVGMPLTALVRNLGRMTQLGVTQRADCLARITCRLTDPRALAAARVHPMTLLEALCTYRNGQGARGVARWEAVPAVCEALEAGFYLAFKNVEPTGRRYVVGLDVSGSMCCQCAGMTSVQCRQAAAAVLMSLVRSEPWLKTLAFSHELVEFNVGADEKLESVVQRAGAIPMGGTDCALPMLYATERRLAADVFVILTDNETWFGGTHPTEALRRYRSALGLPNAKLVVLGLSSSGFSIADPEDPGMMDVAGLDSAVPRLIADFVCGRV
ncbi:hypothetical protein GPECTOR_11g160 [Gonium pectorale]|uniref:TROVE domain-containing protein n=1 Tax=Gonium pectorale TaxID=33097 RepID=A0A150GPQ2_GONPE|nr:hypothetical protein GPECTOR_11g160 [Gonium pectorale]|eukprot:KXZ51712.1 hypothetical protein GPECTOR_11g160 [Gonium pectorale]